MRQLSTAIGLVSVVVLATACEVERISFGEAGAAVRGRWDPWLETGRSAYTAWYTRETIELDVGFTFHNRGRSMVAVPRCGRPHGPALDKLLGGEWVEVLAPLEQCWEEPLVIGPGRSEHFTARIRAGRPHTFIEPQFRTNHVPGVYRLRWEVYHYDRLSQFGIGGLLPIEHRVSNEFRVTH